jgi:hypothetical protein
MPRLEVSNPTEHDYVVEWRVDELERAGYARADAERLAADMSVDLHEAVRLLEQGCPPGTALRILL